MNATHDSTLRSWIESANDGNTDFPIQNLPFGVFRRMASHDDPRIGVAIGNHIIDLAIGRDRGLFSNFSDQVQTACRSTVLNPLMALGYEAVSAIRHRLSDLLRSDATPQPELLVPMDRAELLLPCAVGGYTDFYASIDHARNVGRLFRPDNPLLPNYKYVPIAYHGRTSSLVVSGTSIRRPSGQIKRPDEATPIFRSTARLDYEAEIAFVIGVGNSLGEPIGCDDAERHVFGFCLLNDWSARDIQAWEYQPLGPFLGKNFATTISPWLVTLEALEPFRTAPRERPADDPPPLPHLTPLHRELAAFDITVEAYLRSAQMQKRGLPALKLSHGSFREMYWTVSQMIAHHTSNGCNLMTGDLLASGTVSGADDDSHGCLLEITRGSQPIALPSDETRVFLEDGDAVILRAHCDRAGYTRIGFGESVGIVNAALPAQPGRPDS